MQKALGFDLDIDPAFGNWLAGFADGEAAFMIHPLRRKDRYIRKRDGVCQESHECNVFFQIKLRIDDIDILLEIQRRLGCGDITASFREDTRKDFKNSRPTAAYRVRDYGSLMFIIVPLFEQFPLRAKKRRDFEIWKKAVEISYLAKTSHRSSKLGKRAIPDFLWDEIERLSQEVKDIRNPGDIRSHLIKIPPEKWDKELRRVYEIA